MEASSSSVSKFDAKKIKWSLTKFQFQFELSLAQLSPSLLDLIVTFTINLKLTSVHAWKCNHVKFWLDECLKYPG